MNRFFADVRCLLVAISVAAMLLCVSTVSGADSTETNRTTHTTASIQTEDLVDFDLAKLQVHARIVYVSSGARPLNTRMIDDDLRTLFRFSNSDLHPTVIIRLAQSREVHRITVAYTPGATSVDVYLLNKLPADTDKLHGLKPIASIDDLARGDTSVEFPPTHARYVALRWTREMPGKAPFQVAEVSAFASVRRDQLPAPSAFAEGEIHLPGESGPDFSNKLGTVAEPPTIASVSP